MLHSFVQPDYWPSGYLEWTRLRSPNAVPPLATLTRPTMSAGRRLELTVLRGYLVIATSMVVARVVQLTASG